MTGKDLEEGFYKKNHLITVGIRMLIASLILGAITGGLFYFMFNDLDETFGFICFFGTFISGVLLLISLIYIIMGAVGRASVVNFVNKAGEEKFMQHLADETLYIYAEKNRPVTIITTKFIIEVDRGVYRAAGIDYCYGYSYRGNTSIKAYDLNNRCTTFAYGIMLRSNDATGLYQALAKVNPDLLIGYNSNNAKEHKRRVKEAKAAAKDQ